MLHPRRRAQVGAAVAALSIVVAGCGGGEDGKPVVKGEAAQVAAPAPAKSATATDATAAPAAAKLSRAEYIERADKVCLLARGVSRRANEVVQKAFGSGSAAKAAEAIDDYVPLFAQHQRELKDLPRPAGADRKVLDGLIKVMDGQIQALSDESKALRRQDQDAMAQITEAQQQEVQFAEELGRQYGFRVCGRTSGAGGAS
jgi:hypothetical protein